MTSIPYEPVDWRERKRRLRNALKLENADEEAEGRALDLHFVEREQRRGQGTSSALCRESNFEC